jgi:pimeloyl-CoA synthetase
VKTETEISKYIVVTHLDDDTVQEEVQKAMQKKESPPDYMSMHQQQIDEAKFTWGNCLTLKRQFPVNVALDQIVRSPE